MNLVGVLGALAAGSAGFAAAALKVGGGSGREVTSANKTLVRKLYREVWNQADSVKAKASAGKFISEEHILIDPRRVPFLPRFSRPHTLRLAFPPRDPSSDPTGGAHAVNTHSCAACASHRLSFTWRLPRLMIVCAQTRLGRNVRHDEAKLS
jgi:hypothetical protein